MPRCFFTGVVLRLEDAFVINRRATRVAIDGLQSQVQRLQRLLDQLGTMDAAPAHQAPAKRHDDRPAAPMRHRVVCKGMAAALAEGFPGVVLFEAWPDYLAHARGKVAVTVTVEALPVGQPEVGHEGA